MKLPFEIHEMIIEHLIFDRFEKSPGQCMELYSLVARGQPRLGTFIDLAILYMDLQFMPLPLDPSITTQPTPFLQDVANRIWRENTYWHHQRQETETEDSE